MNTTTTPFSYLQGLLGMREMEDAIGAMVEKAERLSVPFQDLSMSDRELIGPGFLCLISYGWLVPAYPNGTFVPSDGLVDRMKTQAPWGSMKHSDLNRCFQRRKSRMSDL